MLRITPGYNGILLFIETPYQCFLSMPDVGSTQERKDDTETDSAQTGKEAPPKIQYIRKEAPSSSSHDRRIEKPFKEYAIIPPVLKSNEEEESEEKHEDYKPLKHRPYISNQNMDYIYKDIEIEDNFKIIMELIKDLEEKVSKL